MTPETLKAWRSRLGLTQASAAEALGVPKRTLEGWEAGRDMNHPKLVGLACAAVSKRLKPVE